MCVRVMKLLAVLLAVLLAPAAAPADDSPIWYPIAAECRIVAETPDARRALAAFWFEQGRAQVDREAFWEAERSFACSQAILAHPSTLYNLARAAEWAGDLDSALRALREYLDASPDAPNREEVEALALDILGRIQLQDAPPADPPPGPVQPPPVEDRVSGQEVAGWIVVGVAGGAAAATVALGAMAGVTQNEIDDPSAGLSPADMAGLRHEKDDYILSMSLCAALAGAAALTGILLLVYDDDADGSGAAVVPAVSADGVGLAVVGRF